MQTAPSVLENGSAPTAILVLDDEDRQLLTVRAQLASVGEIHTFNNPDDALRYLEQNRCDAIIADVRMPECSMDGFAFVRAARKIDPTLGVIFRTADESSEITDTAAVLGNCRVAIKTKTTLQQIQSAVRDTITETRSRRHS